MISVVMVTLLAKAITNSYHFEGILSEFIDTPRAKGLKLLEINPAGGLTSILMPLEGHKLVSYPDYDMTKLAIESAKLIWLFIPILWSMLNIR